MLKIQVSQSYFGRCPEKRFGQTQRKLRNQHKESCEANIFEPVNR